MQGCSAGLPAAGIRGNRGGERLSPSGVLTTPMELERDPARHPRA